MPSKKTPTLRTKKKLQALQRQVNANDQEVQQAIRKYMLVFGQAS
jgi:hypothetical protein